MQGGSCRIGHRWLQIIAVIYPILQFAHDKILCKNGGPTCLRNLQFGILIYEKRKDGLNGFFKYCFPGCSKNNAVRNE
jgi:hypothetical protein